MYRHGIETCDRNGMLSVDRKDARIKHRTGWTKLCICGEVLGVPNIGIDYVKYE